MRARSIISIALASVAFVASWVGSADPPTEAAVDEIVGVVLGPDSIPIRDELVTLTRNGFPEASTRSGVSGGFRFAGVATGSYRIDVATDRPDLLPTSVAASVTAGQTTGVTVVMNPAAVVEVTLSPAEAALQGSVSLVPEGQVLALARHATPQSGTARFGQLPPGRYDVLVTSGASRWASEWYPDSPVRSGARVLDVGPGASRIDVELEEATWITGRVFLPDRTPDPAAAGRVAIEAAGAPGGDVPISCNGPTSNDVAGTYRIECLHPSGRYLVSVPGDETETPEYYLGAHRREEAAVISGAAPRLGVHLYLGADDPTLVPITPSRQLDTRLLGPIPPAGSVVSVPTMVISSSAVMANVTVDAPRGAGFATVYPCREPRPLASHVNYGPGETASNAVVVPVDDGTGLCVYTSASAHIIVDITARIPWGATPATVVPARIVDTRAGMPTADGVAQGIGRRLAGSILAVQVTGRGNIPAGARASILNVTAVTPDADGFVTVYPCDADRPNASNLNVVAGQTVPNAVVTKLDAAGRACVYTSVGSDLVIDTAAYVPADGVPTPVVPARLADTRPGFDTIDGASEGGGRVGTFGTLEVQVAGRGDVPLGAVAAMLNVTAVAPARAGYLTVYACDEPFVPNASNVNYTAGEVVPNAVTTKLDALGRACIFSLAPTDIVVDVNAYVPQRLPAAPI